MAVKILSVDDELDLEILLTQYFRRKIRKGEYEFSFAHNGLEALKMVIEQKDFDIFFDPTQFLYTNSGSLKVWGLENVLTYDRKRWYLQMNMTYQRVIESENYMVTNSQITGVPDFKLNIIGRYRLISNDRWRMNLRANVQVLSNSIHLSRCQQCS